MALINLHAHSLYSDGHDSIAVMALECKRLGHCAAVITDHCYALPEDKKDNHYNTSLRGFNKCLEEADAITQLSDFPVIIGIELGLRDCGEEVVVIGTEAIRKIYEIREENKFLTVIDLAYIRRDYECVINLCHPMNAERAMSYNLHKLLDGYEFIHSGCAMFKKRENPYAETALIKLSNSDAHSHTTLYRCCNVLEEPVTNEYELIYYFKNKRSIGFHIVPHKKDPMKEELLKLNFVPEVKADEIF